MLGAFMVSGFVAQSGSSEERRPALAVPWMPPIQLTVV